MDDEWIMHFANRPHRCTRNADTHTTLTGLLQGRIMGEQDGSGLRLVLCVVRARFLSRRAQETGCPVTRKNKKSRYASRRIRSVVPQQPQRISRAAASHTPAHISADRNNIAD